MQRLAGEYYNDWIIRVKVKLFLKQGISRQLVVTQLFDLNVRIQQLTWSLIFYEKYSTSLSYLWFWPPLILGCACNFCRYYTRSQTCKSTGYRPTLKPLLHVYRTLFTKNNKYCIGGTRDFLVRTLSGTIVYTMSNLATNTQAPVYYQHISVLTCIIRLSTMYIHVVKIPW